MSSKAKLHNKMHAIMQLKAEKRLIIYLKNENQNFQTIYKTNSRQSYLMKRLLNVSKQQTSSRRRPQAKSTP